MDMPEYENETTSPILRELVFEEGLSSGGIDEGREFVFSGSTVAENSMPLGLKIIMSAINKKIKELNIRTTVGLHCLVQGQPQVLLGLLWKPNVGNKNKKKKKKKEKKKKGGRKFWIP